ncbi:hypothetical protein [Serratia quinivorans]|uniref:hypothetical protein n=1 Tax=Serratia quinivorans TaxID=137545 RepID=UPI003981EF20
METIATYLGYFSALCFWIGLFKPRWVRMPNRKISCLVFFLLCLPAGYYLQKQMPESPDAPSVAAVQTKPIEKQFTYNDVTLLDWKKITKGERVTIINEYLDYIDGGKSLADGFYNCMSQHSYTKNGTIKVKEALGWCHQDYEKEPLSLARMINFDRFKDQVRSFDDSYRPLTAAIKESMNDPSTFDHVETKYRFVMNNSSPYAVVTTVFRGSNSFGAIVKNTVSAKVDLRSGDIIEYL